MFQTLQKDAALMQVMNSLLELLQCTMLCVQERHTALFCAIQKLKTNVMLIICHYFLQAAKNQQSKE